MSYQDPFSKKSITVYMHSPKRYRYGSLKILIQRSRPGKVSGPDRQATKVVGVDPISMGLAYTSNTTTVHG